MVVPMVSWLMPVYNGAKYIRRALDSMIAQTLQDFEIIIIIEYGCTDNSLEICLEYAERDHRVEIFCNDENLGITRSLNRGLDLCKGKYVARMDADDFSYPERLEKQVAYMESNSDAGMLCTNRRVICNDGIMYYSNHPTDIEEIRARLLFGFCLNHPSLMFRNDLFKENGWEYPTNKEAEDYALCTMLSFKTKISCLPDVLLDYYEHGENAIFTKFSTVRAASADISRSAISNALGVDTSSFPDIYFGWRENDIPSYDIKTYLLDGLMLLKELFLANEKLQRFSHEIFREVLSQQWKLTVNIGGLTSLIDELSVEKVDPEAVTAAVAKLENIFFSNARVIIYGTGKHCTEILSELGDNYPFMLVSFCDSDVKKQGLQFFGRRIIAPKQLSTSEYDYIFIASPLYEKEIREQLINQYGISQQRVLNLPSASALKFHLERIIAKPDIEYIENSYQKNRIPYKANEKIRIVFLYQIASFWPSWESLYEECIRNEHFQVKLVLLNEVIDEVVQIKTARIFLQGKGIPYIDSEDFDIDQFKPHIVVYQTPFDKWHRNYQNWSLNIKAKGIRIAYIPYGIEIGDTDIARREQFDHSLIQNAWRVFTLSEKMLEEYKIYSSNPDVVRATGFPKFDSLYYKGSFELPQDVRLNANGRKICLWKAHFPKQIEVDEKEVQITPYLEDYLAFAESLKGFSDLFFIFMPHPKFYEMCQWIDGAAEKTEKLFGILNQYENVLVFEGDDYRPVLMNADYVITDRSAIMIEAGALDIPVLNLYNRDYKEPMTPALVPLIESFYQGTGCDDMIRFLNMCRKQEDYKKSERNKAFRECVPYYDGACGKRIVDSIIRDINSEVDKDA